MTPAIAFDFDGTLAKRDTLLPFLVALRGWSFVMTRGVQHAGRFAQVVAGRGDRDVAKEKFLASMLKGVHVAEASACAERFAEQILTRGMRRDTVARLRWHIESGHRVVVVSASPELVVEPVARRLGVHDVIATRLETAGPVFTGRLLGANVRAEEKVRRCYAEYGDGHRFLYAYGDSSGDIELLKMADHPVWVRGKTITPVP